MQPTLRDKIASEFPPVAHMKRSELFAVPCFFLLSLSLLVTPAPSAEAPVSRPPITGVARVRLFATNVTSARTFYEKKLGLASASACSAEFAACLAVNGHQQIILAAAPSPVPPNLVAEITLATPNVAQMRRYLISKGLTPGPISGNPGAGQSFALLDPEHHAIAFLQSPAAAKASAASTQISAHLIHAGFIVQDRLAEDRFYQDILGFHLYWQGGMKDGETSWVSIQVPDGTDWLEYMLNIRPDADHHTVGVMNHIALGVADIQAAKKQFLKNGGVPGEEPKLGRDGKWQLNLYDPDDTRVEFMEFKPVEKPCCSEFKGTHPSH